MRMCPLSQLKPIVCTCVLYWVMMTYHAVSLYLDLSLIVEACCGEPRPDSLNCLHFFFFHLTLVLSKRAYSPSRRGIPLYRTSQNPLQLPAEEHCGHVSVCDGWRVCVAHRLRVRRMLCDLRSVPRCSRPEQWWLEHLDFKFVMIKIFL